MYECSHCDHSDDTVNIANVSRMKSGDRKSSNRTTKERILLSLIIEAPVSAYGIISHATMLSSVE